MSAYGKSQPPSIHGFDAARPFTDAGFPYSSHYATHSLVATSSAPSLQNVGSLSQMDYSAGSLRGQYDNESGPFLNIGGGAVPQITSYSPSKGTEGSKFVVRLASMYDLMSGSTPTFSLMFGSQKVAASASKINQQGSLCQYVVTGEVPMQTQDWSNAPVSVSLLIENGDGELTSRVEVGNFTYIDRSSTDSGRHSSLDLSRKRKYSPDLSIPRSPVKRASSHQLRPKDDLNVYGFPSADSSYSYMQPSTSYGIMQQYGRGSTSYHPQPSPRNLGFPFSSADSPKFKAESPQVSNWSPYSAVSSQLARSPALGTTAADRQAIPALSPSANPPLIRTSTIQSPSPGTTPAGAAFNPYALYPHKAVLKIQGDLDAMAENWTPEEWEAKRRLVLFKRSQSGSTITTTFKPVSPDERPSNSVCISCILWEEKNECYVTSVDTIFLLEQLVAARFTVEEKNRIRRNLEGFRPLTVSKAKADSEEFFKVIMQFPNPKPRNIEKDVKVFPWKILAHALKKIIGKYSASPSSTLPPALLNPINTSIYGPETTSGDMSHSGVDPLSAVSPRTIPGPSAATAAYASALAMSKPMSPRGKPDLGLGSLSGIPGSTSDGRLSVPSYLPHMGESSSHWQGGQHHMAPSQYQPQVPAASATLGAAAAQQPQLGSSTLRDPWDYLDPSSTGAASSAAQGLSYSRIDDHAVTLPGGPRRISNPQTGHPIQRRP